ncbi:MAG TPA: hypothetical protein VF228_12695 [Iamia sp.]
MPTCTADAEPGCLSGTEVQALEAFDGKLYAGTTSWEETLSSVWPRTSAQVNVLSSEDGAWERTPDLPGSPSCASGIAPWEQVNDLQAATFTVQGETSEHLFASVLANEDGGCPGLQATVFHLDEAGGRWVDTGLGSRLATVYGDVPTEVRYIEAFADGTADCPTERPCLFAFVGPRGGTAGPSAWRATYDPADDGCRLLCWDAEPEVVMGRDGAPPAARIVSSAGGPDGLLFGTTAAGIGRCPGLDEDAGCNRAALMRRAERGIWEPAWLGTPVRDGGPEHVRGIASWAGDDGTSSTWFVTAPDGIVHRTDATGRSPEPAIEEITLGTLLPEACGERMLPYQLYIQEHDGGEGSPRLLAASQSCASSPPDVIGRIFHRPVTTSDSWAVVDLPTIAQVGDDRANEAAIRCIETSPFDDEDLYVGTTDMNSTPASLTARIYRVPASVLAR